uniref:Chromo domain-containing protein n=1 Tax=Rhabditophanes sp. KR3021 TaxID=114890 RepID=A0AC35TVY1_9BILA
MSSRQSSSESDTNRYEIDRIGDRRWTKRGYEYEIFWRGYTDEECTWEPKENISEEIVAEYDKIYDAQRKLSASKKKTIVKASDMREKLDARDSLDEITEDDMPNRSPSTLRSAPNPRSANPRSANPRSANPRSANPRSANPRSAKQPIRPSLRKDQNAKLKEIEMIILDDSSDEDVIKLLPQKSKKTSVAASKSSEPSGDTSISHTTETSLQSVNGGRSNKLGYRKTSVVQRKSETLPMMPVSSKSQIKKMADASTSSDDGEPPTKKKAATGEHVLRRKLGSKKAGESGSSEQSNSGIDRATSSVSDGSNRRNPIRSGKLLRSKHRRIISETESEEERSKMDKDIASGSAEELVSPLRKIARKGPVKEHMSKKGKFFGVSSSESSGQSEDNQAPSHGETNKPSGCNELALEIFENSLVANDVKSDSATNSKKNISGYLSPPKNPESQTKNLEAIAANAVKIPQKISNITRVDNETVQNAAFSNVFQKSGMGSDLPFDESKKYVEADIQGIFGTECIHNTRVYSVLLANKSAVYLTSDQVPKECHHMVIDLLNFMTFSSN